MNADSPTPTFCPFCRGELLRQDYGNLFGCRICVRWWRPGELTGHTEAP